MREYKGHGYSGPILTKLNGFSICLFSYLVPMTSTVYSPSIINSIDIVLLFCVVPDEESPLQSRKTSPSTSPSSSVYGGTSNPSQPPSESADGPFKKRSKPAVILRKVKKSLTSTITENVTMREGSSTGRPVAMVKGLISSLASSMSQGNVAMPTADVTFVTTMDPRTNDTPADDSEHNGVVEKPIILSDVANQLSEETLVARYTTVIVQIWQ